MIIFGGTLVLLFSLLVACYIALDVAEESIEEQERQEEDCLHLKRAGHY